MKPKRFFFTPEGGLGNRIRSIASAYAFSKEFGYEPTIYWFADKILINVHFCELFEPIDFIHEGNNVSAFLYDRSRKKTLWIPGIFQKLSFDRVIYSAEADEFYRNEKKYSELSSYHRLYMTSYRDFFPYDNTILARLFVPVPKIRKLIDERCSIFNEHTIGVQIRRTDHAQAIRLSPTELFIQAIDKEIADNKNTKIYLASDSEEVKKKLSGLYGDRIITAPSQASRDSSEGVIDGLVEMFALSRTRRIYGSFNSSFSQVASQIGNIPLIIINKTTNLIFTTLHEKSI